MSNSIAPGSSADVNVKVTALTTNPNVPVTYKTVILKKNLVNGVNTLTQEMMSTANTKYVIKYNYVLGEDVTIPIGCILEFDGGNISGEHTIIGQNTLIKSINENIFNGVLFAGSFLTLDILANWFAADNDAQMFQKAFDFARKVYEGTQGYYEYANPKVTCLTKVYHIDDTINIKYGISFDGNGAQFNPTENLVNKWMFKYNIASDDNSWEQAFTVGEGIHFCNLSYSNPNSILSHFLYTGSPIKIHDIEAFRPAKFIYYTNNYIDKKYIKNCVITGENTRFPLDVNDFYNTCSIRLGLGDSCEISNIADGTNIYIGNSGQVRIDGAINVSMYIADCNSVSIRNIHNEKGVIYVKKSTISIEDSYFHANQNGNIKFITEYNKFGEISLKNCVFSNLKRISDFHSYYPIVGLGKIISENTFGLLYPDEGSHNSGHYIGLKYNENAYINCNHFIANNGTILDDNVQFESGTYTTLDISKGNDVHIRMFLLADKERRLYLTANNTAVDKTTSLNSAITLYDVNTPIRLSNAILRIEIGDTDSYTHYFDFPIVNQNKESIFISKKDDVFYIEDIPFKPIDYTNTYINCSYYKRTNDRIYAELSDNTLPSASSFKNGDTIRINSNNLFYTKRDNEWLSQNMFYTQSGDSTNTWVKILKKKNKPNLFDRIPSRITIVAVHIYGIGEYVELYLYENTIKLGSRSNGNIITKVATYVDSNENTTTYYCYINSSFYTVNCLLDGIGKTDSYYDRTISNVTLPDGANEYSILLTGTTSERNNYANAAPGMSYFDKTLGKPIWWNGTNWVDATGTIV